jgi:UDP-glucose 4-epimerase
MNALIIGGAGFVGSNLVRRCLAEPNAKVTVLDFLDPFLKSTTDNLREVWDRIQFVRGDMADAPLIAELVADKTVIFNCAAQTSHPLSLQDPLRDAEINCLGTLKVLEAVRQLNPKAVVVYTSSSTVIGRAEGDLVDEKHGERPLDIYSANKGVAEKYHRIYHRVHDLKTVVLRFANLYGPYGKGFPEFGFLNYFIHLAWSGKAIDVFGSGAQTRNVLFVEDACEVMLKAAAEPKLFGEAWFATHEEHLSVLEIAREIVRVLGRGSVNHVDWPETRRRIEIDSVRISSQALHGVLDWKPRYSFSEGLARTRRVFEGKGS